MSVGIRPATPQDAEGVLAIYAPIVARTAISFEIEPPSIVEMRQRIAETTDRYPWLVCHRRGEILGYAYACGHRARAAYRWSVEASVYVRRDRHRRGIGRGLYTALLALLRRQGFRSLFAGITLPNAGSVGLHESLGFEPVGIYRNAGHKLGTWHDVGWWQRSLADSLPAPKPPIPFAVLRNDDAALETAWQAGLLPIRA